VAFKVQGLLIFFSGMKAGRNLKVVGEDVAVLYRLGDVE
jgi:hypothetical protein